MSDDKINIDNEEKAHAAIEEWREKPLKAQFRYLNSVCEKLELNQMYYEQKGNDAGAQRMERCLVIMQQRLAQLEEEDQS